MTPRLPGYKPRRSWTEAQETVTSTRTLAELESAILEALEKKPMFKTDLRHQLQEPEVRLTRLLTQLRKKNRIKLIGTNSQSRRWALLNYDVSQDRPQHQPFSSRKPESGKTSWWLEAKPEGFTDRARGEQGQKDPDPRRITTNSLGKWPAR